ncbi:unnamed protein product [Porites lobata]|uniref:Uncharacterized protein n=1 Tax=Porites lobata TaxID=104759 RepID=A0ABN8NBP6_9CNID|nr:unnamed protein product [Porites lobata]
MDQKLEVLNYINYERLDLEELAGTEATLYETIAALPAGDLSTVIENYLTAMERTEDLLQKLDELKDKFVSCQPSLCWCCCTMPKRSPTKRDFRDYGDNGGRKIKKSEEGASSSSSNVDEELDTRFVYIERKVVHFKIPEEEDQEEDEECCQWIYACSCN